jgi:ABC-2 type transport system ATP-binding protein
VLKKINLEIEEGDFFALLGHNGAGKTTMISILTNLVNKSS